MTKPATLVAAGVCTLALAGGVGVGIAAADPSPTPTAPSASSPSTSAKPSAGPNASAKGQRGHHRGLQARALHGEATVGGKKKTRVIDFQRGAVTKADSTSVTVKSVDGFSATYVVDTQTKVRKEKKEAAIADVKAGDRVRVVAVKDGSTVTAKRIGDRGPR